jgi:branched-chain amino acid transport system ATP-binding protein
MLLNVEKINVFYGDLQALYDLSFYVQKGEIVSVIGSNGAGKSTTMNAISGVFRPSSGKIIFKEKEIQNAKSHQIVELGLIQIPEARRLFPYMSVIENLELGAFSARARKDKDNTLKFVYELFPVLKDRKNQIAGTLSGGEQQMLAIGRGIMNKPTLLMLDEPSLGLAPKLVRQVFEVVQQINCIGITVLLVEQNVYHSLEIAHRGYVLEHGSVIMEGKGKELLKKDEIRKAYLGI